MYRRKQEFYTIVLPTTQMGADGRIVRSILEGLLNFDILFQAGTV
jgi:hypothetical protein